MKPPPFVERVWITHDLHAVVIVNNRGFRWGYVCLRLNHPLYRVDHQDSGYDGIRDLVHGGLIFSGEEHCLMTDPLWAIGFKCNHALMGDLPIPEYKLDDEMELSIINRGITAPRQVRSLEYVIAECEKLAEALSEASSL